MKHKIVLIAAIPFISAFCHALTKQTQAVAPMTVTVPQSGNTVGITVLQNDTNNNPDAITTNGNITTKSLTCTGSPCGSGGGSTTVTATAVPFGSGGNTIATDSATFTFDNSNKQLNLTNTSSAQLNLNNSNVSATVEGFNFQLLGSSKGSFLKSNSNSVCSDLSTTCYSQPFELNIPAAGNQFYFNNDGRLFAGNPSSTTVNANSHVFGGSMIVGGYGTKRYTDIQNIGDGNLFVNNGINTSTFTSTGFNVSATSASVTGSSGLSIVSTSAGQLNLLKAADSTVSQSAGSVSFWASTSSGTLAYAEDVAVSTYIVVGTSVAQTSGDLASWCNGSAGKLCDSGVKNPVTTAPQYEAAVYASAGSSAVVSGATNLLVTPSTVTLTSVYLETRTNLSSSTLVGVYFDVSASTTVAGTFGFQSKTIAQLRTITPSFVGQVYYCSDCTATTQASSTSTVVGSWATATSKTTFPN